VGDIQPRKNHIGLIKAFAKLVKAHPQLKHKLVLVGKATWFAAKVEEAARESGVADRIVSWASWRCGIVAAVQCVRRIRVSEFLRRLRIAGPGSNGMRAGGGVFGRIGAAGSGG